LYKDGLLEKYEEIAVIGFGATGQAVADFLVGKNVKVFVSERNRINPEIKANFQQKGIKFEEGSHSKRLLNSDLIVLSPGVHPEEDLLKEARELGISTIGEIEFAYLLSPTDKIVAVTGTNGKSTTVKLINEILNHQGINSISCGNIGTPFISVISSLTPADVAVVETSSYQLQTTESFKPRVAVLTNLEPDHLGRHGSFEKYSEAKLKVFRNQDEKDCAVIKRGLNREITNDKPTKIEFGPREPLDARLLPHQKENVGAALAAVNCLLETKKLDRPPPEPVRNGLQLPYRLETVRKINGVEFINDSKATNPAATIAAIEGFTQSLRLLLGGKAKRSGYKKLVEKIEGSSVCSIYLFGAAGTKLADTFRNHGIDRFDTYSSLEDATKKAFSDARQGEVVLLSPGCSSFDRFDNFEERGERFTEIVNGLPKKLSG